MGIHSIKKVIVIMILVAFIGIVEREVIQAQLVRGPSDEFIEKNESRLVRTRVGNYSFRYIALSDAEVKNVPWDVLMGLNSKDVFIVKESNGYFIEGQKKEFGGRFNDKDAIFAVSQYHAFYRDSTGTLWVYAKNDSEFTKNFSANAQLFFNDIRDHKITGLALLILNDKSLKVEQIVREEGSRLLKQGQLNGIAEEIRKFL